MPKVRAIALALGALLPFGALAQGVQLSFTPLKDTSIYSDSGELSDGVGPFLWIGNTGGNTARRPLLEFDLSAIPVGSIVTDATLSLHVSRSRGGAYDVSLHRLLREWGEGSSNGGSGGGGAQATAGDATWTYSNYNTVAWSAPGGDFVAAASGSASVGGEGSFATWSATPTLLTDVQSWIGDPTSNHGWILIGDESGPFTAKRFESAQNSSLDLRPVLTLQVTPVPEASKWILMLAGLGLVALFAKRGAQTRKPV